MLIICWLLFAFPMAMAGAFLLGARVYYCGVRQQSPGISPPRFSFGKTNGENGEKAAMRLPEV